MTHRDDSEQSVLPETLGEKVLGAMRRWNEQKAAGVSKGDRLAEMEGQLREWWPKSREVFKYQCNKCDDLGLTIRDCPGQGTDARYHYSPCGVDKAHGLHTFGVVCTCDKGRMYMPKAHTPGPSDMQAAGRQAPKQFKRYGS